MREFRVTWCQCPHVYHTPQIVFVEAFSAEDARVLVRDHVERHHHVGWFSIQDVSEVTKALPPGRVKS